MISIFGKLLSRTGKRSSAEDVNALNYDDLVHLDAEDLAEQGVADAYQRILPELGKYVLQPAPVEEIINDALPSYVVRCAGVDHLIYSPEEAGTERESWGRATYYFFRIVNDQLGSADVSLYAVNGGNDLGAMFLTPAQALAAQQSLERRQDWPYIPSLSGPWFGQYS